MPTTSCFPFTGFLTSDGAKEQQSKTMRGGALNSSKWGGGCVDGVVGCIHTSMRNV